ncbi:Na+/H+ antiporter NhaC family protein [Microbacterium barkeri]|uniref:YfcC family protein n=1 Tax=Microbacterium barkeri TaxID=33917 RepID=UPI0022F27ECE|nr:Na+/H+ antiporter NhaC family protein [Microbacterium barkeri]MDI6943396.1 Na+/H+ antiporter NhaC family protein [Microbacterium barkeri]MDR6878213.1 putative ion transporter superfamily protein YfcC [Microbacterium barkeri]
MTATHTQIRTRRWTPDVLTILLAILALCAIATYVVPAGKFQTDEHGIILPGTFEIIPSTPVNPMAVLTSLHTGLVESAPIIFGILFTGGALAVLDSRGALTLVVQRLASRSGSNRYLVASAVMLFFGVCSALGTITSEVIAFLPLALVLARALEISRLTAVMTLMLPASIGYAASFLNPSSLALAQTIAGLPLFSGALFRVVLFGTLQVVTMAFVLWRIRRETRETGFAADEGDLAVHADRPFPPFGWRHVLALAAFVACLALFVTGTVLYGWGVGEMAACFVLSAVLVTAIFGIPMREVHDTFIGGMRDLMWVVLVIGTARAIAVVLSDGQILDTIVSALGTLADGLSPIGSALALTVGGGIINFFIGSGTGQAALTMPIIAPLTDVMGITRQVGVLSFQLGDGITNLVYPTSSVLVAGLATAGVSFGRWFREAGWYLLTLVIIAIAAMTIAVLIGYN